MLKLEEQFMIKDLYRKGVSISEIARRTGRDRKTIRQIVTAPLAAPSAAHRTARPRSSAAMASTCKPSQLSRIMRARPIQSAGPCRLVANFRICRSSCSSCAALARRIFGIAFLLLFSLSSFYSTTFKEQSSRALIAVFLILIS